MLRYPFGKILFKFLVHQCIMEIRKAISISAVFEKG
jgi:hypothetical protein